MGSIFAERMEVLGTETAFEVLAKAKALEKQGKEVVHIAEYISETRNIEVNPEEVVVTPGAKPVLFFSILALVNPGDEILNMNPGFPIYESVINFVGAKQIPIPLEEKNDFRFDPEYVKEKITKKTKMIVLNSPENPTGGVLTKEDLKTVADCIEDRDDVFVISDEVYSRIIYEGEHESVASLSGMKEKTILLDGFSKTYAMTGWRLGYGVMRKDIAEKITQLMINSNSCTCAFVQMAGVEALNGPQDKPKQMVAEFKKRREVIVSGLNNISGIACKKPRGAFYVFPNITGTGMDCRKLSDHLLNNAGVAVLPGTSFGQYGKGYLRLSFANSVENIKKALNRISEALKNL